MSAFHARALALCLAAVAIATVTDAKADAKADERSTGATSATFASLPTGTVPLPPKARVPSTIPGGEKVAGFLVSARKGQADFVTLVSSAKMAKQMNEGFREDTSLVGEACFTEDQQGLRRGDETERAWRPDLQPMLGMSTSSRGGQRPTVTAVHSERIAEEGGKTSLEVIDAWVDPVTRGVRLIARSSVPLELVSTVLGGTKLYAARDAQSVHVILVTPNVRRSSGRGGLFAIADNAVFSSSCDHIRTTLKTEKGQGQTASFISNVELPPLEKDAKDRAESKPDAKDAKFGITLGAPTRTEVRVRPIHVHASITWPSREKEPLLSVSAGWDSREQTAIAF